MRTTQRGIYLILCVSSVAAALGVLVVERLWVTDEERIEAVVYEMRDALLKSDADGILAHLAPDVHYVQDGQSLSGDATRALIRTSLSSSRFDSVRVHGLQTSAGRQTRRGNAEFRVFAQGSVQGPFGLGGAGTSNTSWSLGFEQPKPGVWQVNRITPVSLPYNVVATLNAPPPMIPVGPPTPPLFDRRGRRRGLGPRMEGRPPVEGPPPPGAPAPRGPFPIPSRDAAFSASGAGS